MYIELRPTQEAATKVAQKYTAGTDSYAIICKDKSTGKFTWFYSGNPDPNLYEQVGAVRGGRVLE
jgi:hypothetical protein